MKLKINGFENEILFDSENVNILEIYDAKCFSHIIEILNEKINGMESNEFFLLNDENVELNISKEMYMIFDLFNIDYNSKKILTKIYDVISENIKNNQDLEMTKLIVKLRNYIIQEINELPFEFVMNDEIEISELLKIYNLKIDSINYQNILERVELLIDIISTLKIANILVIPNLKLYLSSQELVELYKYSLYNNVRLLLIERKCQEKLRYEKIFVIDENFNDEIL